MQAKILHTAEVHLAGLLGITHEQARATIRDVVRDARPPAPAQHQQDREVWTTGARWQRLRVIVERDGDVVRVIDVVPRRVDGEGTGRPNDSCRRLAKLARAGGLDLSPAQVRDMSPEQRLAVRRALGLPHGESIPQGEALAALVEQLRARGTPPDTRGATGSGRR